MKQFLLIFLFCTTASMSQAQEEDNRLTFKISPLSLINLYDGPCYKVGAELKIYRNLAAYFEYGGYFNVGHNHWWWKEHIHGFLTKSELRFYLNKDGLASGGYLSTEYYYRKQDFGFWATIRHDSTESIKDYHIWKEVNCFNLKYGYQEVDGPLALDMFAGMGVWLMNARDDLSDTERINIKTGEHEGGTAAAHIRAVGKEVWFPFTFGVRIGYGF